MGFSVDNFYSLSLTSSEISHGELIYILTISLLPISQTLGFGIVWHGRDNLQLR